MTMTQNAETDEATQALPHELGCIEWLIEEMQEAAGRAGVQLDGEFDDVWRGMTLIERVHMDLAEGTSECRCTNPPADPREVARAAAIAELISRHAAEFEALYTAALIG
jgi:hypothetical protein